MAQFDVDHVTAACVMHGALHFGVRHEAWSEAGTERQPLACLGSTLARLAPGGDEPRVEPLVSVEEPVTAMAGGADGRLWLATGTGLWSNAVGTAASREWDEGLTFLPFRHHVAGWRRRQVEIDGGLAAVRELAADELVVADGRGGLWRLPAGGEPVAEAAPVAAVPDRGVLLQAADGALWAMGWGRSARRRRPDGVWLDVVLPPAAGDAEAGITATHELPDGRLVLGCAAGGIMVGGAAGFAVTHRVEEPVAGLARFDRRFIAATRSGVWQLERGGKAEPLWHGPGAELIASGDALFMLDETRRFFPAAGLLWRRPAAADWEPLPVVLPDRREINGLREVDLLALV